MEEEEEEKWSRIRWRRRRGNRHRGSGVEVTGCGEVKGSGDAGNEGRGVEYEGSKGEGVGSEKRRSGGVELLGWTGLDRWRRTTRWRTRGSKRGVPSGGE